MRRRAPASVRAAGLALAVLVCAALAAPAAAQPEFLVNEPGTWKAWRFTATPTTRKERAAAPAGSTLPLAGALSFGAFPIFQYERNGRMVHVDTGETELLLFHVNELQPWLVRGEAVFEWRDIETDAFLMPASSAEVAGFPRYGDILVIKKNPAPLWVPLSLADALRLTLRARACAR